MNTTIDFARLVKKIREARGLTQEQFARDLEVTFGTVNAWENGRHQPLPVLARRLVEMAESAGIAVSRSTAARRTPSAQRPSRRDVRR
jgi:putative transcriptional regulator